MSEAALFNGQACADALAHSRGLHYGDGVFRTMLVWQGRVVDQDRHLRKLATDARALHLDVPDPALLDAEITQLAQGQARAVIKLLLLRQAVGRGYAPRTAGANRLLLRYAAPTFPPENWEQGIRAATSAFRLGSQPALAGIKHLNRLEQVLASRDWPPGVDEVILRDEAGNLVSGSRTNLFWVSGGTVYTPALDRCGVEGITRNTIMDLAEHIQVKYEIVSAPVEALRGAQEAWVCNALVGLWPLRELDDVVLKAPGPVTRRLSIALAHPRLI